MAWRLPILVKFLYLLCIKRPRCHNIAIIFIDQKCYDDIFRTISEKVIHNGLIVEPALYIFRLMFGNWHRYIELVFLYGSPNIICLRCYKFNNLFYIQRYFFLVINLLYV
jgi:hypothetical protein